jgi:hypothetical protein
MTEAAETEPSAAPPARRARRRAWVLLLLTAAALGAGWLGWQLYHVVLGTNWHAVLPGRVYRCAQLLPDRLQELAARYGVRTVVNLRGCGWPEPWYVGESQATHRAGLGQEDLCFSAGRLPSRTELRRLLEILDRAEYPLVLHCRQGADRTGLVSAIALLLQDNVPLAEARRQLGPRYGHVRLARTGFLDDFLDLYEGWLRGRGQEHSPAVFRDWLLCHYHGGHCGCVFECVETPDGPLKADRPTALAVRVRNMGEEPWHLRPTETAGVHLGVQLLDADGVKVQSVRAGLLEADVAPGQSIDLTAVLPPVRRAGVYRLLLDMKDEQQGYFYQMGSEPFECEVQIRE